MLTACLGDKLKDLISLSAWRLAKSADKSSWVLGCLAYETCEVLETKTNKEKNMYEYVDAMVV